MDEKELRELLKKNEKAEWDYRSNWIGEMNKQPEYKKIIEEMRLLRKECEKIGHIKGRHHNNGFGWGWYYCARCRDSFDKQRYP